MSEMIRNRGQQNQNTNRERLMHFKLSLHMDCNRFTWFPLGGYGIM